MLLLKMFTKWRLLCTTLVIGGSLLCAFHFYKSWSTFKDISLPIPDCDLRLSACTSTLPTGESVELRIKPTHMPVLTSVQLEVKTEKISPRKIYIEFKGAEMNMGEFRSILKRRKQGFYTTQTILPTCIQDQMVWHAIVHIESNNRHYSAPFILVTQRPEHD